MSGSSIFTPATEVWKLHGSLFHYTSAVGLFGIIKDGYVRATHSRALNDSSESELVWNLLKNSVSECLGIKGGESASDRRPVDIDVEAAGLVELFREALIGEHSDGGAYITSFCGMPPEQYDRENGLLNMWQGYGPDGGYAIEFETLKIESLITSMCDEFGYVGGLHEVLYASELGSRGWANEALRLASQKIMEFRDANARNDNNAIGAIVKSAREVLIPLIIWLKHPAFHNEKEVRIGLFRQASPRASKLGHPAVEFYVDGAVMVPYVKLFEASLIPAIRRVIVGPHRDADMRAATVRLYLRKYCLPENVTISDIPYRPR